MSLITQNGPLPPSAHVNNSTTFDDVGMEGARQPSPPPGKDAQPGMPGAPAPILKIDPLRDVNGAPTLAAPIINFTPEDLITALENLRNISLSGQEVNARGKLEKSRIDSQKASENQQIKVKEWSAECDKAAAAERRAKIFGWLGKILAFLVAVVAVVATIATAGTAAPVLLTVACIGLAAATLSVIDQGVKDFGISEGGFNMSHILGKPMEWILRAAGVDKEKAEQIGLVVAGAAGIAALGIPILVDPQLLGEMSKGICQLAGASESVTMGVTMGVGLASTITVGILMAVVAWKLPPPDAAGRIVKVFTGAGAQIVQGSTQVTQGGNTIARAVYEARASNKMADKKVLEAMMVEYQRAMETSLDEIRKIIQQLQEGVESVSALINSFGESSAAIVANLNKVRV